VDIPPEFRSEFPPVLGSVTAVLLFRTHWARKVAYFFIGWGLAHVFGEKVRDITGVSIQVATCLAALFALAIIEKVFDTMSAFDTKQAASDLWAAFLRFFGGRR
jgi:hypothetical protein